MAIVMTNTEFVKRLKNVANNYKTLYVMGSIGSPMTQANKERYCNHTDYNQKPERQKMIKSATADTFGFDCVCLLKAILWGWNGDKTKVYGGATYASNGVPDIGADAMITKCTGLSTNFSQIEVGEAVWCQGHIGVYIGDGLAVECTPAWKNCVQITAVTNIGTKNGYNARKWTKHGKLPYIQYVAQTVTSQPTTTKPATTTTTTTKPQTNNAGKFKVGDIVQFTGTTHYTSASALIGKSCKGGKAKITAYANGTKHPYHLVNQGGGCTVYGWVNEKDIATVGTISKGSKVKINKGAVYGGLSFTRGRAVPSAKIGKTYTVSNIATHKGVKEALIKELYSWVAVSSLTLA